MLILTRAQSHTHTHTHTRELALRSPSCAVLQASAGIVQSWQLLSACVLLLSFLAPLIHHVSLCMSLTLHLSLCEM